MTESRPTGTSDDEPRGLAVVPSGMVTDELGGTSGGPSRRLVFGIVTLALFMSTVDVSIVATALPAIHRSLRASINWTGWTITVYSLGNVIVLPIAGKFSDQFGRRRIFLIGIVVFTAASLLCGFATDVFVLIVFRALQAIGGGALQPSAAGIVADHFGRDRDRALGMFSTIAAGGQITGPIIGGLIVGYLSWRWIFFVNVPLGVVLVLLVVRFLPESRLVTSRKTDIRGLFLMAACILAANFGITSLGNTHTAIDASAFLVPELAALVLLVLFVRHTRRAPAPFIPMQLLRTRGFATMNTLNFLFGAAGFGVASLVPLYAEQRYHLSALSAGTLLTARGVGAIAIGAIAAFALRRTGYRLPMIAGFSLVATGALVMSVAPRWGITPYLWLSLCSGIAGLGNGVANPASRNACLQLAPDSVAAITGLRSMFNYIGTIFSVAIVTAILNRSTTPGLAQAHVMWVAGAVLLCVMVPLVRRVPEHKGSW